jgi:hypothetical protein
MPHDLVWKQVYSCGYVVDKDRLHVALPFDIRWENLALDNLSTVLASVSV